MFNIPSKKNQQGFILVTVMLLTMMAGTVVLTSLQDSTVQERLSGNYQKKINSRLIAERGVYEALNAMDNELDSDASLTIDELAAELVNSEIMSGSDAAVDALKYGLVILTNADDSTLGENEISVYSLGNMYEGQVQIRAIYELITASSSLPAFNFGSGVTGCESVNIAGSGYIDSYDSSIGNYDVIVNGEHNKSSEANVQTIYKDAGDITASNSNTSIKGDVIATGNVSFSGTSLITGNVHANGDVTLSGIPVGGNIISRKKVALSDARGHVDGYILAQGDVTLDQMDVAQGVSTHGNYDQTAYQVLGKVNVAGNVSLKTWGRTNLMESEALTFGGTATNVLESYKDPTTSSLTTEEIIAKIGDVPSVPADDPTLPEDLQQNCDPYDIGGQVDLVNPGENVSLEDLNISAYGQGNEYLMSKSEGYFTISNGTYSPLENVDSAAKIFLGNAHQVLMYENVILNGHLKVAEGADVTMYVRGDFDLGAVATLTIPDNSSLTLIIEGKFTVAGSAEIYTPVNGLTADLKPVFSIYSSYDSTNDSDDTDAISFIGGGDDVHAVVYAPLANVSVKSAVSFKGSVYGNQVSVSGAGSFHYDVALANVGYDDGSGSGNGGTRLVFKGWKYITEELGNDNQENE